MKIPDDHDKKKCAMCLGVLCKKCENVSRYSKICVDCAKAPLRNRKVHVIYNFLRREGALASLDTLRDSFTLLKSVNKSEVRQYDPDMFFIERIHLRSIFGRVLKELDIDIYG